MTVELAKELIRRQSLTPHDAGCQELIAARLERAGCSAVRLHCEGVDNIWLSHGSGKPVFAFLGHTDVVPTGPVSDWISDPFNPVERDGFLYGRGAADMKGGVAAMVTALERFVLTHPRHAGTAAILLTSDEEGPAINGTVRMLDHLAAHGTDLTWCLVGEPSSRDSVGDVIKNGRRGSLTGRLIIKGTQGHVAYPQLADNPIHRAAPALAELCGIEWDRGNEHYPPTTFQISNLHSGTGADNVIPGALELQFNFRYSTALDADTIKRRVGEALERHKLRFHIDWRPPSLPFLTSAGPLLSAVRSVIAATCGREPEVSTTGGTSDGRFAAARGAEVVELGPVNRSIHQANECVRTQDLETASVMYERILEKMLLKSA